MPVTNANPPAPVIHAFQTGRQYTAQGQRIAYVEVGRNTDDFGALVEVAFYDIDRGIDGRLKVWASTGEVVTNAAVLQSYDLCAYVWNPDYALKDRLHHAALALPRLGQ